MEFARRANVSPLLSADRLAELTSKLVAVPSVNGQHGEAALADLVRQELESAGFTTELVGSAERPSLAAVGGNDAKVLLNGHTDTVPVDDPEHWRFDPFGGVNADGAVHGRGACDMKGGLAIQVAVAQWLASEGTSDGLVLHFAMGEERGEPGTEDLIGAGFTAPLGVVLEPTDFKVGVAQRGLMTIRIRVIGRAGHASRPDLTDNPIDRVPTVLGVIKGFETESGVRHDLLGSPTWTTTGIHSGIIPSMVPGQSEILVDRRMIPGETVDSVMRSLDSALGLALPNDRIETSIVEQEGIYEPAEISSTAAVVDLMATALESCGEDVELFGTPYSSDIRHLINAAGIEAVTFGPGRFTEMHARDEFIEISHLARGAKAVAVFSALAIRAAV